MNEAKDAARNGGQRSIIIAGWKPLIKNTLRAFFSATLPSGITIHNLALHEKGESRWIGLPAREWTDQQGTKQYAKLIEFLDRAVADRFRDEVLAALTATPPLDSHLPRGAQEESCPPVRQLPE
jgi:hypothetical protein